MNDGILRLKNKCGVTVKLCIGCLMVLQLAKAQNLIPDSSFERNTIIPTDFSQINASYTWSRPGWGTTDLFCKCDKKQQKLSLVDVPQNPMGYQEPHSGSCYAGIFAFSHGVYREYLQTPLTAVLEKNKWYCFAFYISMADYSRISIDQMGVCFLNGKATYNTSDVITNLNPVYMNIDKETGREVEQWHRISVNYKAYGGENYLLLGSFEIHRLSRTRSKVPKEIRSQINQKAERDAYYFIDDVSLVETVVEDPTDIFIEPKTPDEIAYDSSFVFKTVLFQTNEVALLPSSYSELNALAEHLQKNPHISIAIAGHTDNSGNERTNNKLSLGRAKAVSDYLVAKGISKTRITYRGYGSLKPVASNETEEGRGQNRRVEFRLTEK